MKILVIPQTYPDEQNKRITPFIRENTCLLVSKGFDVSVLHVKLLPLKQWFRSDTHRVCRITEDGLTRYYREMRYVHGLEKYNTWLFYKCARKLFFKYCKEKGKPDVIISHFYQYAGYAAAKIAKENSIPFVHIEHAGWLLKEKIAPFEIDKLKKVLQVSDQFVCVSEMLRQAVKKAAGDSCTLTVIPNVISDCFRYTEPVERTKYVFFSAGNLYEGKRFPMLVDAFCTTFSGNDEVELRIAGSGNLEKHLKEMISENQREQQIKLLGALDQRRMQEEYINCDCFVLPSEHETFGIVYREAMACGRPIITTDHQGFVGDWSDEHGMMIHRDNQEELIHALAEMQSRNRHFDGRKISRDCIEKYAAENIIKKYERILNCHIQRE